MALGLAKRQANESAADKPAPPFMEVASKVGHALPRLDADLRAGGFGGRSRGLAAELYASFFATVVGVRGSEDEAWTWAIARALVGDLQEIGARRGAQALLDGLIAFAAAHGDPQTVGRLRESSGDDGRGGAVQASGAAEAIRLLLAPEAAEPEPAPTSPATNGVASPSMSPQGEEPAAREPPSHPAPPAESPAVELAPPGSAQAVPAESVPKPLEPRPEPESDPPIATPPAETALSADVAVAPPMAPPEPPRPIVPATAGSTASLPVSPARAPASERPQGDAAAAGLPPSRAALRREPRILPPSGRSVEASVRYRPEEQFVWPKTERDTKAPHSGLRATALGGLIVILAAISLIAQLRREPDLLHRWLASADSDATVLIGRSEKLVADSRPALVAAGTSAAGALGFAKPAVVDVAETPPPPGVGRVLSPGEVRYCVFQGRRLGYLRQQLHDDGAVQRFNILASDFNSRCGNFRFEKDALAQANERAEGSADQLKADATMLASGAPTKYGPLIDLQTRQGAAAIQATLKAQGFYKHAVDGIWGPNSAGALSDFRAKKGLGPGAVWDLATQWALLER